MLLPCHAVPLKVYIVSFPFDLHSEAVLFTHLMPRPCHVVLKETAQGHSTARHGDGMACVN
jgi:hypothetical protein